MNVVNMIAVLSVGKSSAYGASRITAALADRGQAPKILGYIDRSGRPLVAILFSSAFSFICYIVAAGVTIRTEAFDWMIAISGLAANFTWGSICLCHIRFRAAWKLQGHILDELAFRSQAGVVGSWIGFIFKILILIAQFWTAFAPVDYASLTSTALVQSLFQAYYAFPIVVFMFIAYKIIKRTRFVRLSEIDVDGGKREIPNLQTILAEERAEQATLPWWKKRWKSLC